jgi:adenylate cyclase
VVDTAGDSVWATFDSVVEAVQCASVVQTALGARNQNLPDERRMAFRIGVNLGDVIEQDDGTIYGDGVNVAARLESLAEPGGICLSGSAHEQVEGKTDYEFEDIGAHDVKNIARPVRAYRIMVDGQVGSAEPTKSLALPDKPSIAVLPFDNMSGDPEQEYFADGIAEAITAALSRIRSFFVIARNSAFTFKGRSANVLDIGRELGVAYVLEGSVQRAGQRLRITAQLVETDGGAHVWADHYDGTIDNIFDLQDLITELVAGALQPSIRVAEIERARRKRPQDLSAYDYTMRAMPHVWSLEKEESARALTLLGKALLIEPDYPLALSLAAWCHAQHSVYNWVDDIPRSQSQALELAEKSAELSGDDPLILAVLGTVHTFVRNFGTARVLLERALALDPNAAWAYSRLGWLETYSDHSEIALEHFERALRLSPLDPMNFNNFVGMGSAHQIAQDYDKAIALFKRALEERPHADWIYRNLTPALVGGGYMEEASDAYAHLIDHYPDLTVEKIEQAMIFSKASLERMVENLKKLGLPD